MLEKDFKNKLIPELREYFHVIDLSLLGSSTGAPDLMISRDNRFILAELKIIPSITSRKLFKNLFEPDQIIFYKNYRRADNDNIYFILYSKKEEMSFIIYLEKMMIFEKSIKDILCNSIGRSIDWLGKSLHHEFHRMSK